ncbi:hypothetical protein FQA39_LY12500 [Lamprigera yunnana]|nr:hypothetical protein FQA39_LY12500 [Lamprigera yunnana]
MNVVHRWEGYSVVCVSYSRSAGATCAGAVLRLAYACCLAGVVMEALVAANAVGMNEVVVHVATALGPGNVEYFLWRAMVKVNCNYGSTAPNISGLHKR